MKRHYSNLLTIGNPKTAKGENLGYLTAILHLSPVDLAGRGNVCPFATPGCAAACLNTAGRGGIIKKGETTNAVQEARKERTRWYFDDRAGFKISLFKALQAHQRRAWRHDLKPAVRLNGTSDMPVYKWGLMQAFPAVQFYDYTKNYHTAKDWILGKLPDNYHVTFSRAETEENQRQSTLILHYDGNVAVVFGGKDLPEIYQGRPVVDGDSTDLRFLDGRGVVVGLRAKGKGKKDTSGFVVQV